MESLILILIAFVLNYIPIVMFQRSNLISIIKELPECRKGCLYEEMKGTIIWSAYVLGKQLHIKVIRVGRDYPNPRFKIRIIFDLETSLWKSDFVTFWQGCKAKGQLISKCLFGVIVWTKKPMQFFPEYLP